MAIQIPRFVVKGQINLENAHVKLISILSVQESAIGWAATGRFGIYVDSKAAIPIVPKEEGTAARIQQPDPLYEFDVSAEYKKGEAPEPALYAAAMKQDICKGGKQV